MIFPILAGIIFVSIVVYFAVTVVVPQLTQQAEQPIATPSPIEIPAPIATPVPVVTPTPAPVEYPNCRFKYAYYISGNSLLRMPTEVKDCPPDFNTDSQIVLTISNDYSSNYDPNTETVETVFNNILVYDANLNLDEIVVSNNNTTVSIKDLVKQLIDDVSNINYSDIEELFIKRI